MNYISYFFLKLDISALLEFVADISQYFWIFLATISSILSMFHPLLPFIWGIQHVHYIFSPCTLYQIISFYFPFYFHFIFHCLFSPLFSLHILFFELCVRSHSEFLILLLLFILDILFTFLQLSHVSSKISKEIFFTPKV